jgi:hypothetical protein
MNREEIYKKMGIDVNPLNQHVDKQTVARIKRKMFKFCRECDNKELTTKIHDKINSKIKTKGDLYFLMEYDRFYKYPFLTSLFQLTNK